MSGTGQATEKVVGDLHSLADTARDTANQAKHAGSEALGHARDIVHDTGARVSSLAGNLQDQASAAAETQKSQLADKLDDVAKAVHRSGEAFEGQQDFIAKLIERGSEELTGLAETLRTNDLQGLLTGLGSLAKRQPALFIGASMAAGFALTRVGRLALSGTEQNAAPTSAPTPEPGMQTGWPLEAAP